MNKMVLLIALILLTVQQEKWRAGEMKEKSLEEEGNFPKDKIIVSISLEVKGERIVNG